MKIVKISSADDIIRFNWHLLDWCNYKCSYCSVGSYITNDFSDTSRISQNYKLILARLKTVKEPFDICLTGGEPTLHPNFYEVLDGMLELKQLNKVWLFSNLSRSADFLKQINNYLPKIQLYASWHPEFSKEDFVEKAVSLDCHVHVSITDDKKYWPKTLKVIDNLKQNNVTFRINILQGSDNFEPQFDKDVIDTFETLLPDAHDEFDIEVVFEDGTVEMMSEHKLQFKDINYFKGYKCTPKSYSIGIDGSIANTCTREKMSLGLQNIVKPVICPLYECTEGLLMYPKELHNVS